MFDKKSLETLFDDLRDEFELEPDWEEIQRSAHLGVALSDAGVAYKTKIDKRVLSYLDKHKPD